MTTPTAVALLILVASVAARRAVAAAARRRAVGRLCARATLSADVLLVAPRWLEARLSAAAMSLDARVATTAWAGALVILPAGGLVVAGPGLMFISAAAIAIGPLLALHLARGRRSARIEAALPLALESVARTLRTGGSLRQAVTEAAAAVSPPLADDLVAVAALVEHGAPLSVAVEQWVQRRPLPGVRLAAAALALGAETGGAQARAIDGVAATVRERLAAEAEVRAQATQARVSAAVIALAPLAFCALASATDARTATFLFRTPGGLVLLAMGLGLDTLGAMWMARLTQVAT